MVYLVCPSFGERVRVYRGEVKRREDLQKAPGGAKSGVVLGGTTYPASATQVENQTLDTTQLQYGGQSWGPTKFCPPPVGFEVSMLERANSLHAYRDMYVWG